MMALRFYVNALNHIHIVTKLLNRSFFLLQFDFSLLDTQFICCGLSINIG
jgi:hypothetical protein